MGRDVAAGILQALAGAVERRAADLGGTLPHNLREMAELVEDRVEVGAGAGRGLALVRREVADLVVVKEIADHVANLACRSAGGLRVGR